LNAKYDHWGYENIKIVQKNKSAEEIEVKLTMRLKSKLILPMFREWVEKNHLFRSYRNMVDSGGRG